MRRFAKTLLGACALSLPLCAFSMPAPAWINRVFVASSGYQQIDPGVYAPSSLSAADRQRALADLAAARARIAALYGAPNARPVTILAADDREAARFGLADGVPGTAFVTAAGTHVVLNLAHFSVDVTAHELTHAELAERLGFWTRMTRLPVWLDEGLALQLDWRPTYQVDCAAVGPERIHAVQAYDSVRKFWSGDVNAIVAHYQAARCAAAEVLAHYPARDLYAGLTRVRRGESVDDVFRAAD